MKLDRNINPDGMGKYALILLRKLPTHETDRNNVLLALRTLLEYRMLDYGDTEDSEFFLIRLKDKYAAKALQAYSIEAHLDGQKEWAEEVLGLAGKAQKHPGQKQPD